MNAECRQSVLQEVLEHLHAVLGQDGLRVELDAVDWEFFVHQAHDGAALGLSSDLQAIGQGVALDDEGVIAGGSDRAGKSREDTLASMENRGGLAVHETIRTDDFATKNLPNGLVAKADAKDRD